MASARVPFGGRCASAFAAVPALEQFSRPRSGACEVLAPWGAGAGSQPPRGAVLSLAAASASRHRAREATGGLRGSCAAQHRSPPHTCAVAGRAVANAVSPVRQRTGRDALQAGGTPSRFSAEAAETLC